MDGALFLDEDLRAGSGIQVLYDRDDPAHSYAEGEGGMPLGLAMRAFLMAGGVSITEQLQVTRYFGSAASISRSASSKETGRPSCRECPLASSASRT